MIGFDKLRDLTRLRAAVWLARLAAGGVFVYASAHKILYPAAFARDIYNYQLLPDAWINPLAIYLPWLELFCGLALISVRPLRRGAALLIGGMLAAFIVAIVSAMARGLDIRCGCFTSPGTHRLGWLNLALDAALLPLTVLAARRSLPARPRAGG